MREKISETGISDERKVIPFRKNAQAQSCQAANRAYRHRSSARQKPPARAQQRPWQGHRIKALASQPAKDKITTGSARHRAYDAKGNRFAVLSSVEIDSILQ